MKPPLDPVIVTINGREHGRWTGYEIDSDLFLPADDWHMTLALPVSLADASLALWQNAIVRVGGDVVLHGRIDRIRRRYAKDRRQMTITGRNMAGVLCDCSAPIFTVKNVTLQTVVDTVANAFGIGRVNVAADGLREKVSIEPGMSAWDAIAAACELNGCHAWFEPDGTLTIGGPDYTADPVGILVLDPEGGRTNVLDLDIDQNISGYFSEVTVLAQAHGTARQRGQHAVKQAESDALLLEKGIYRPKIVVDGDAESAAYAGKLARKYIADGKFSALAIRAEVRGHRAFDENGAGPVWTPGQRVRLVSVPDGIDDVFFLASRTLTFGEDGQKTRLTLKPDSVWLPDVGKRKKGRKGKKNTGPGRIIDTTTPRRQ